jgi:hypothetical protein
MFSAYPGLPMREEISWSKEPDMYRTYPTLVLTVALIAIMPVLAASGEDLEEWDARTTLEDDNTHTLDSVEANGSESLDSVDTGETESLDAVEDRRDTDTDSAEPSATVPGVEDGDW